VRFTKQMTIDVPRQVVWDFLWDVPRLSRCIPGCEKAEVVEPYRRYQATVAERVGPFRVKVPLAIEIREATPPVQLRAQASGKDTTVQSLVKVGLDLTLVEVTPQVTALQFTVDVSVLGKLGTLGHSIIVRKGDEIIAQFAEAIQAELHKGVC